MTDVPGHTKAIVPYLARNGISFLHIGINPASCPVEVPGLFRWQFSGEEVIVMYDSSDYGGFMQIPGTDTFVYFAHTGDNMGPQSAEEIFSVYDKLYEKYPGSHIVAADLNDVAEEVALVHDSLPIISDEIGDTWIHGIGTDPKKMSQFRALLRFANEIPELQKQRLFEHILLIPEHTWGLDEKTHLNENKHYKRDEFDQCRNDARFIRMEQSWDEQRAYVLSGVEALDDPWREQARNLINDYKTPYPDINELVEEIKPDKYFVIGDWRVCVANDGSLCYLAYKENIIADGDHPIFAFSYDAYSADEAWSFFTRYNRSSFVSERIKSGKPNWASNDFYKEGIEKEITIHKSYTPVLKKIFSNNNTLYIFASMEEDAVEHNGSPSKLVTVLQTYENRLYVDFRYYGKRANRSPEALWLRFTPYSALCTINKLGYDIDPTHVASKGNREMHAVEGIIKFENFSIETLDATLVSLSGKHIYGFENNVPDLRKGIFFNLFNNQWGTNFPMWTGGDRRFRFIVTMNDR